MFLVFGSHLLDVAAIGSKSYMDVSENSGFSPQIIHFNRVFHYFHHPFWGTPILGNTHMNYFKSTHTACILTVPCHIESSPSNMDLQVPTTQREQIVLVWVMSLE